jgi:hypothetical protein
VRALRFRASLLAALVLVLCIAAPAAATDTVILPAASATPSTLEVQFWPSEPDGSLLVVGAELPAQTRLPATVRVPLPAGATVTWVGEVFGGDPSADTEVSYVEEQGVGGTVIVATLTKSRSLQYEATLASPTDSSGRMSSDFTWVQSAPGPQVGLSVKMTSTTGDVLIEPGSAGAPQTSAAGERLYTLPPAQLALGTSVAVDVSWVVGAPITSGATSGGSSTVLYILAALLAVALAALAAVTALARGRARV